MKFLILLLLIFSVSTAKDNQIKIYTLEQYKKTEASHLKKQNSEDIDFGINLKNLSLLSTDKLNLKLGKDYFKKCTIAMQDYESNATLENLLKSSSFFNYNGIYEHQSKPTEVVYKKNRALIYYYGSDKGAVWASIKLIVKFKKYIDIYQIDSMVGELAPVTPIPQKK